MERRIRFYEAVSGIGALVDHYMTHTFGFVVFVIVIAFIAGAGTEALVGVSVVGLVAVFLPIFVKHYFAYLARRLRERHQCWG